MAKFTGNKFKYTESELRDRGIGKFLDSRDQKWLLKKATYKNELVWTNFTALRDSFRALFTDAKGYVWTDQAHTAAEIVMDKFLVLRSRGENVTVPKEVVPVNAVPGKTSGAVELFDAAEFVENKTVTENDKIRWVADNMNRAGITPATALSEGTYYMLMHYRETKQRQEDFYKTILPKLLTKEDADKGGKLSDSGKETIDLIDRLIAALPVESEAQ